jgi:peroxiredoxin (alkyl hydroperoxide reductase subunit C)
MRKSTVVCLLAALVLAGCIEEGGVPENVPGMPKKEAPEPVRIGDQAPAFEAESTSGPVKFPDDFRGRWVVLFSHPGDFTPVATTEFMRFAERKPDFDKLSCTLLALSVDTVDSHMQWLKEVAKIRLGSIANVKIDFPVVADPALEIAKKYGMVHPNTSRKQTVRTVFVIDQNGVVRATMAYPPTTGRSVEEIHRLVLALQAGDHYEVATPANWQAGEDVILRPLPTEEENRARARKSSLDYHALAWFLCMKRLPDPERTLRKVQWPVEEKK